MTIAIVGAGIAGTCVAHWLRKKYPDTPITLIDASKPYAASVGPTLLCHPFPGRSLAPHPHLGEAMKSTSTVLQEWQEQFPNLIRNVSMWRPLKGSNAKRLSQSHQDWWLEDGKHRQRNTWIEHPPTIRILSQEELNTHHSHKTPFQTLATGPAFAIDAQELFPLIHQSLANKGVRVQSTDIHRIERTTNGQWCLHSPRSSIIADKVVLALGRHITEWFPNLNVSIQGGSLMRGTPETPSTNSPALSLDGLHIGTHHTGDWVFGSTRWTTPPDDASNEMSTLRKRLHQTLPNAPQMEPSTSSIWSGMRSIFGPDRLPLAGELAHHRNLFVLTALGSKGWLWGPWAAYGLAKILKEDTPPIGFDIFNIQRASFADGWYSPLISEIGIPFAK